MAKGLSTAEKIGFGLLLVVVVLIFSRGRGGSTEPIARGTPMPELMAEGWINVAAPGADADGSPGIPSRENLAGKVVVLDVWATWCGPCVGSMPKLAKIHEQYQAMGVEFVGLCAEPASARPAIESFIGSVDGFTWPVGYGVDPTLDILGVQFLPTIAVYGKDGRAVWSSTSAYGLETALDEALAR